MIFMLSFGPDHPKAEERCSGAVCFYWAFGAIKADRIEQVFIKISGDTELQSGDQLKMLVKLNNKCFVYVFYHSSQGELYMLFPYNLSQFSNDYEMLKNYYIPQGDFVLELDEHVGKEKIYLLASAQRIPELENLYNSYEIAEDPQKPEFIKNIIQEIRKLKKHHTKFTIEAERPVASTGSIRAHIIGDKSRLPELDKIAIEYTAKNFFAKTFTIDHKKRMQR
jgi:hypothetical protein